MNSCFAKLLPTSPSLRTCCEASFATTAHATRHSLYCRAARTPMYGPLHAKVSLSPYADKFIELHFLLCVGSFLVAAHSRLRGLTCCST